jgi:hypothetical protein
MKFTDKYEILELLTTGRVSTFHARDRKTQEQVIVHSFEYAGAPSAVPDPASIAARFGSLAPAPAGVVIETGFDELSSAAYLVARLPLAAALQEWIRAYRSFVPGQAPIKAEARPQVSDATAELSASEVEVVLGRSGHVKQQPTVDPRTAREITKPVAPPPADQASSQSAGEFTRLFRELGAFQPLAGSGPSHPSESEQDLSVPTAQFDLSSLRDKAGVAPGASQPAVTKVPDSSEEGTFTQQFFAASKSSSNVPVPLKEPAPAETSSPGAFTREFLLGRDLTLEGSKTGPPVPKTPEPAAQPPAAPFTSTTFGGIAEPEIRESNHIDAGPLGHQETPSAGAGEFTNFFSGPFDRPAPLNKPISVPEPIEVSTPRNQPGEFTQIFGSDDVSKARASSPITVEPEPKTPGTFTQIFGADSKGGAQLGSSSLGTSPSSTGAIQAATTSAVTPVSPTVEKTPPVPPPLPQFASTSSTSTPGGAQTSFLPRTSPADATDIFRARGGAEPPPIQDLPTGPSEFTQFLSRSQISAALPKEPVVAPPPPATPPAPQFQFAPPPPPPPPPVPKPAIAVPKMPGAPPPAAGLAPAGSMWPLITVLTILLAIGALLVMYFVLKH